MQAGIKKVHDGVTKNGKPPAIDLNPKSCIKTRRVHLAGLVDVNYINP